MGVLLTELGNSEIISAEIAVNLRNYIAMRNPQLPVSSRAGIFVDAVNRIVDGRLPRFEAALARKLKELLFRDITKKQEFSIDCSDIFKASVKLRVISAEFLARLNDWLSETLKKDVIKESLFDLVIQIHKLMDLTSGDDITPIIALAEKTAGGLKYYGSPQYRGRDAVSAAVDPLREEAYDFGAEIKEYIHTVNITSAFSANAGAQSLHLQKDSAEVIFSPVFNKKHGSWDIFCEKTRLQELLKGNVPVPAPYRAAAAAAFAAAIISFLIFANNITAASGEINRAGAISPQAQASTVSYTSPYMYGSVDTRKPSLFETGSRKMRATAYDLSIESCGKTPDHPLYGITSSGTKATVGRTIAVDPEVIPLGSRVYISFPPEYSGLDGVYTAEDTGRLIKGDEVDIFFGEDEQGSRKIYESAMKFGVRYVDVTVVD